jgi:hypothetical protein
LAEAQRQADLQREELNRTREERDRLAQSGRDAQGQLVELGRLRQQMADAERDQARLQTLEAAVEKQAQEMADLKAAVQKATVRVKPARPRARSAEPTSKGALKQAVFPDDPAR